MQEKTSGVKKSCTNSLKAVRWSLAWSISRTLRWNGSGGTAFWYGARSGNYRTVGKGDGILNRNVDRVDISGRSDIACYFEDIAAVFPVPAHKRMLKTAHVQIVRDTTNCKKISSPLCKRFLGFDTAVREFRGGTKKVYSSLHCLGISRTVFARERQNGDMVRIKRRRIYEYIQCGGSRLSRAAFQYVRSYGRDRASNQLVLPHTGNILACIVLPSTVRNTSPVY